MKMPKIQRYLPRRSPDFFGIFTANRRVISPCIMHLQQDFFHRTRADIVAHIHRGHDHFQIHIELRHLNRK